MGLATLIGGLRHLWNGIPGDLEVFQASGYADVLREIKHSADRVGGQLPEAAARCLPRPSSRAIWQNLSMLPG